MDLSFSADEEAFAAEVRAWLEAHLEPPPPFTSLDDEVAWGREWQARLAADRWIGIHWPVEYGGRGASPVEVAIYNMEYARARAPQPVNRVGINLAGPTLLARGTDEQRRRWLPRILDASEIWCQLFSEPDAGSDLAALATRAERVDGGWLVSGQKVWTSYAQFARWAICLARTQPPRSEGRSGAPARSEGRSEPPARSDGRSGALARSEGRSDPPARSEGRSGPGSAPRHRGISYFVVDMEAEGIEIRPLVQITGEAEFNEVFLDEVFVPDDHLVGEPNQGWSVANTTLAHERGTTFPFKEQVVHEVYLDELYALAREHGRLDDVEVSDALAQSFVELRVLRLHNWRTLSRLARGEEPGPESSWIKLQWTDMTQHLAEAALALLGHASPLYGTGGPGGGVGGDPDAGAGRPPDEPGGPGGGRWQRQWLWSKAASIAGGTSEIQRTIVAERILGLPRG